MKVTIKGLPLFGGVRAWYYDTPRQAGIAWKHIQQTGRGPDGADRLVQAMWFRDGETRIHKHWSEPQDWYYETTHTGK